VKNGPAFLHIFAALLAGLMVIVAALVITGVAEAQDNTDQTVDNRTLNVDVFWSMRSPYCYIALDRILEMRQKYHVNVNLRIVYPIAIKDPGWFKAAKDMKFRLPYQDIDSFRTAAHILEYRFQKFRLQSIHHSNLLHQVQEGVLVFHLIE